MFSHLQLQDNLFCQDYLCKECAPGFPCVPSHVTEALTWPDNYSHSTGSLKMIDTCAVPCHGVTTPPSRRRFMDLCLKAWEGNARPLLGREVEDGGV